MLLLAVAAYEFDLGERWFGWDTPSPVTEPAEVAPPPGLSLPAAAAPRPVAEEPAEVEAAPAKVRRALTPLVSDRDLGRHVGVAVSHLHDGTTLYRDGASRVVPASTMKLLTAAAALESLGPGHRFRTTAVAGQRARQVVLVGGGDPFLEAAPAPGDDRYPHRADLRTLAEATAKALRARGETTVRLRYDTSIFTGPATSPEWEPSYVPDNVVTPVSPLWTDRGRERSGLVTRSGDPAADAAERFARALARSEVVVLGEPRPARAPADAEELAAVQSAPLGQIVQRVLEASDNEASEVLFRHVAIAEGLPGSFSGAAAAVRGVLSGLGVDMSGARIYDGSGLSRQNRVSVETLLAVIGVAADADHPGLRPVVTGLPVAGFTGSLTYRFETGDERGPGRVRAKTGTLTGVHGLAGVVTDVAGTELGFVAIADRVKVEDTLDARAQLDQIAAALAGCSCGTP